LFIRLNAPTEVSMESQQITQNCMQTVNDFTVSDNPTVYDNQK